MRFIANALKFDLIPGNIIAYWLSAAFTNVFAKGIPLKSKGDTRQGMATSDNNRFIRLWHEVTIGRCFFTATDHIHAFSTGARWFPYNKGGDYRKWYGNMEYVVNYENNGKEVKDYAFKLYRSYSRTIKSISEYFKECLSWSKVSGGNVSFRYYPKGFIFDVAGCCIFYTDIRQMDYDFALVNSIVSKKILAAISPTLNYEAGQIASLPIILDESYQNEISSITTDNVNMSKMEWDSFETSWNFKKHPLV